jgi:microcystin-dependent protein
MSSCNIVGTLKDSGGQVLSGQLWVQLDAPLVDTSATPDTTLIPKLHQFAIAAGVINITLAESETARVTYWFRFFADNEDNESGLDDTASIDFHAFVPNLASCDLSELVPTGVTTDSLDTAIARLARLLTTNQQFITALRGGPRYLGAYDAATYYQRDDNVSYAKSSWLYISDTPAAGQTPSTENTAYWQLAAAQGEPGGTGGNDTVYDATGWNGALWAPSANAIRDKIETLATQAQLGAYAPLASPNFTGNPTGPTQTTGNRSDRFATTNFVGNELALIGKVPIGAVLSWITNSPPSKWVICDGRAISRTTYGDLFTVIGTAFGAGDGSTTFNLPDLRGRTPVGTDSTTLAGAANRVTTGSNTLAGSGGAERVALSIAEMPAHQHGLQTQSAVAASGAAIAVPNNSTGNTTLTQAIGGSSAHQNMPPYLCLNWIIYTGV